MTLTVPSNRVFAGADRTRRRYVVLKGSAGSGKSVNTAQHYLLRLLREPGRNLLCVRKSDVTNRDSTYAELTGAAYRLFGDQAERYWTVRQSPLMLICRPTGGQVIFRGMNDERQREKIKSITFPRGKLTDIWVEEATELTQSDFEILDDRLRGQLPPGLFYQMRLTFNPVSSSHWIKRVFFDTPSPDVYLCQSTYLDNRFIDAAYHRRMERRRRLDPEGYRVYGLGEWGEVGGLILTNWAAEEFDRSPERFDYMVNAQDFGFNHANCIGEVGFRDGELYLCRELYVYERDTEEIIRLAEGQFRRELTMYCDSAEPDRIRMWRKAGYRAEAVRKDPGSVRAQIDYLKQYRIHIHPSCTNTIREIGQWKWRRDERTGRYLDEPVACFDDAMAMLRYAIEQERRGRVQLKTFRGGI